MTNQNYKIRYGRNSFNTPKDTLITVQENKIIYFGISRCKNSVDNFKKAEGKRLALDRAEFSQKHYANSNYSGLSFYVDETGLSGSCHVAYVKLLLKYFESLGAYKKWTR